MACFNCTRNRLVLSNFVNLGVCGILTADWGVRITRVGCSAVGRGADVVVLLSGFTMTESLQGWTSYNLHLHGQGWHFKCDWYRLKNIKTRSLLRAVGIPEVWWFYWRLWLTQLCSDQAALSRAVCQGRDCLSWYPYSLERFVWRFLTCLCLNRGIQTSKPGRLCLK